MKFDVLKAVTMNIKGTLACDAVYIGRQAPTILEEPAASIF
jgi:hypothetical protein